MFNRIFLLILLSGFSAGSVYPLIKIADGHAIPKFAYIFWESLVITALLVVISVLRGHRVLFRRSEAGYYLFCAFTNIIIPQTLFFLIAEHLPASLIGLVVILTPILVYSSLLLFFREPPVRQRLVGVILGLVGASLLFLPDASHFSSVFEWKWIVLSLLLPIDYSLNRIFATRLLPENSSSLTLAIGLFASVAFISGFFMLISSQFYHPFSHPGAGEIALFAHAILMTVFYVIFFVLAREGAVYNSLSFYVAPLTAMGWGILVFREQIGVTFCFATFFVFSGLYLVNKGETRDGKE